MCARGGSRRGSVSNAREMPASDMIIVGGTAGGAADERRAEPTTSSRGAAAKAAATKSEFKVSSKLKPCYTGGRIR